MKTDRDHLIEQAIEARRKAYVPYSHFAVGAALRLQSGSFVQGCNVENASYGLSNCAERTALFKAVSEATSEEERRVEAIAIVANTDEPVSPCGACRQVMAEFCASHTPVYLANLNGKVLHTTVGELLPYHFSGDDLTKSE